MFLNNTKKYFQNFRVNGFEQRRILKWLAPGTTRGNICVILLLPGLDFRFSIPFKAI